MLSISKCIISFILLFTTFTNAKKFKHLTLEDLGGTWHASFANPSVALYPEDISDNSTENSCRTDLPKACQNVLSNGTTTYNINIENMSITTMLVSNPPATSREFSAELYPECVDEGYLPKRSLTNDTGPLVSFENNRLSYMSVDYVLCDIWHVFVDNGAVKATIIHRVDFVGLASNLPKRNFKDFIFSKMYFSYTI